MYPHSSDQHQRSVLCSLQGRFVPRLLLAFWWEPATFTVPWLVEICALSLSPPQRDLCACASFFFFLLLLKRTLVDLDQHLPILLILIIISEHSVSV